MILKPTERETRKISQDFNFPLARLVNITNTAEGPVLPNRMQGGTERVYTVQDLRVARVQNAGTQTNFTLTWSEPNEQQADQLSFYQVFVLDQDAGITQPLSSTLVRTSPAVVSVPSQTQGTIFTFLVQTILKNGQVSDIGASPTCTGVALPPAANPYNLVSPVTIDSVGPQYVYQASVAGNEITFGQNVYARFQGTYTTIGGANTFDITTQLYDVLGAAAYLNQTISAPTGIVTDSPVTVDWWSVFYTNGSSGSYRSFTTITINTTTSTVFSTSNTTVDTTQPLEFNLGIEWTNFTAGCEFTLALANLTFY